MNEEEEKLKTYLAKVVQDGQIEQMMADWAIQAWQALPKTMLMPDTTIMPWGTLQLAWNKGIHHFDIEIFPSGYEGMAELFYLNRETDDSIDTDYIVGQPMPDEITAKFSLFTSETTT